MDDAAISTELQRIRQAMSVPRPLRPLGPPDFALRPHLYGHVHRYSRGMCMDFAARLAPHAGLRLAALHAPGGRLAHAFLVDPSDVARGRLAPAAACMDVSGSWTLAEMRALQRANDGGGLALVLPDLEATLAQMREQAAEGAEFDAEEVVLSVAGCLPHLRDLVPVAFRAEGAESLARLDAVRASGWAGAAPIAAAPALR